MNAIEQHAVRIDKTQEKVRRVSAECVIALGKEFAEAQERLANYGNGQFQKWIKERCGITPRSAYNAINAHATFKDCEKSSQSFDTSALYLLSSDSTPEAATAATVARAEGQTGRGERSLPIYARCSIAGKRPKIA